MIEIKKLHKSYKMGSSSLHVLKGIDFSVARLWKRTLPRTKGLVKTIKDVTCLLQVHHY